MKILAIIFLIIGVIAFGLELFMIFNLVYDLEGVANLFQLTYIKDKTIGNAYVEVTYRPPLIFLMFLVSIVSIIASVKSVRMHRFTSAILWSVLIIGSYFILTTVGIVGKVVGAYIPTIGP